MDEPDHPHLRLVPKQEGPESEPLNLDPAMREELQKKMTDLDFFVAFTAPEPTPETTAEENRQFESLRSMEPLLLLPSLMYDGPDEYDKNPPYYRALRRVAKYKFGLRD